MSMDALSACDDASADYAVNAHVSIGAYYGAARGGGVTQAIFSNGARAHFSYLELLARF